MKKVMKKFNRALSVMLVAAMVLTMAPQTAMPALAAEPDAAQESVVEETGAGAEIDESGSSEEEEITPVIDEGDASDETGNDTENETGNETGNDTENEEENTPEEVQPEVTEKTTDDAPAQNELTSIEINAIAPSASEIKVSYVNGDAAPDAADKAGKATDAAVTFLYDCVQSDKLLTGKDLEFTVEAGAGRYVDKVELKLGDATAPITAVEGVYKKENTNFTKDGKAVNGEIIITTKAVSYTVTLSPSDDADQAASSYKVYEVTTADNKDSVGTDEASTATIKYGESKKFAIELTAEAGKAPANKLVSVTTGTDTIPTTEEKIGEGAAAKTYQVFTVEPAALPTMKDVSGKATSAHTVAIKVVAKVKLTVATLDAGTGYTVASSATHTAAETYINYDATNKNFGAAIVEKDESLTKKSLAFKVEKAEGYKITAVTASVKAADEEKGTAVTVDPATAPAAGGEFTIALNQAGLNDFTKDVTLTIEVKTALDGEATGAKKITFTEAPHVTFMSGSTEIEQGKEIVAAKTATNYKFTATPEAGYELAKGTAEADKDKYVVTIEETRDYPAVGEAAVVPDRKVTYQVEAYDDAAGAKEITLTFKNDTGDKNYKDSPTDADPDRAYTVKAVTVTAAASISKANGERVAHITADEDLSYKITNEKIINDEEAAADKKNTWVIPEGVDELTFSVTADKAPTVTMDPDGADTGKDPITYTAAAGEGTFTYAIPAAAMEAGTPAEITITADTPDKVTKNVLMKVDTDDVTVTNGNGASVTISGDKNADGFYTFEDAATVGDSLSYVFTAKDGAQITNVSYEMGETKDSAKKMTGADGTVSYQLNIKKVTDEVKITVESVSEYEVVLSAAAGSSLKGENGVYTADYTQKSIKIELKKLGVAQDIYNVSVKDAQGVAETAVKLATDKKSATIDEIAAEDRGETLTITVKGKNASYEAKLTVSAAADEKNVTITLDGKAVKDNKASLMADSALTFKVATSGGANYEDLDVEVLSAKENASAADNTAAKALVTADLDSNGSLKVTAKPAMEAPKDGVIVNIINTNVKEKDKDGKDTTTQKSVAKLAITVTDPLVKLSGKDALITKVNAVQGSATNRSVSLNVSVDFKNKKNPPAAPIDGRLYYKVEITKPAAVTGLTLINDADLVQFVPINDFADTAKNVTFDLVVKNTGDAEGVLKDVAQVVSTTAKVTLVQTTTGDIPTKDSQTVITGPEAVMKDNTLATKIPVYETKLGVKLIKGAAVFTGQSDVKVATPVFTKMTSFDTLTVQFVNTKTGALLGTEGTDENDPAVTDDLAFEAYVGADGAIYVTSTDGYTDAKDYKTNPIGVKVTAAGTDSSYNASAIVKLNIKQGIYRIATDESKTALPTEIYINENKKQAKAVSFKIATTLNTTSQKPASAKLKWAAAPAYGNTSAYAAAAVQGKKPLVSVKNGTVTVSKDYVVQNVPSHNRFTITASADDFAGNTTVPATVTFVITNNKAEIDKLVIVDEDDKEYSAASLAAEDLWGDGNDTALWVKALDKDGNEVKATFKSGNAKALAVDTVSGALTLIKPANNIKITASTIDGGKARAKDVKVNVAPFKDFGLVIKEGSETKAIGSTAAIEYTGTGNRNYTLYAAVKTKDGTWDEQSDYTGLKVTVTNGKLLAYKDYAKYGSYIGSVVVVNGKTDTATITVTDTANKDRNSNSRTFTIKNKGYKNNAAPKIQLDKAWTYDSKKGKYVYGKKVDLSTDHIIWKVTDKKAEPENYTGKYVKVEADHTVASNYAEYAFGEEILKIDENGTFTLDTDNVSYDGKKYSLIATVGDLTAGEFVPLAKDVKINFNIPKITVKKPSLSVGTSYTLDTKSKRNAALSIKATGLDDVVVYGPQNVMLKDKEQDADKHTNKFTDNFCVWQETNTDSEDYGNWFIGLNDTLSAEELATISSPDGKANCEGYISVAGLDYSGDEVIRKDVKVKITFKNSNYTLTNATIFSNTKSKAQISATVNVKDGKNDAYVAAWKVVDDGGFGAVTDVKNENWSNELTIQSKANTAVAAGKYQMTIRAVTADSPYVKYKEDGSIELIKDKKENGTAYTMANLLDDESKCVTMKTTIDVKAAEVKGAVKKVNKTVTLTAGNYTRNKKWLTDDFEEVGQGKYGYYEKWVGLTMAGTGNEGYVDTVTVDLKDKDGNNLNQVTVGGSNKVDLVTVQKYDNGFGVRVSKEALIYLSDQVIKDRRAKVVTNYGKTLTVPVKVTYKGLEGTDEIKLNIKMPKNRPASIEEVQKKIGDATAKIQSIETKLARDIAYYMGDTAAKKVLVQLFVDVQRAVSSCIPADSDVDLSYTTSNNATGSNSDEPSAAVIDGGVDVTGDAAANAPDWSTILSGGKARINLDLRDMTKADGEGNPVKLHFTFDDLGLDTQSGVTSDAQTVATAIGNLTLDTYTNSITKESLLNDIREKLAADDATKALVDTRKGHIRLSIGSGTNNWRLTKATTASAGSWLATITVTDVLTGGTPATANLSGPITRLKSLSVAASAVSELFDTEAEVLAYVDAWSGQEGKIQEAIKAAAQAELGNDLITVDYAAENGWTFKLPKPAVEADTETGVAAKPAEKGEIAFTLVITKTQDDGNGTRSRKVTVEKIEIPETDAGKYISLSDAKSKVEAAVSTAEKLKAILTTGTFANTEAANKEAILAAAGTGATGALKDIKGITVAYTKKSDGKDDFTFTPATQKKNATVAFSLDIYYTGDTEKAAKETLVVDAKEITETKADKYQTAEELKDKIAELGTSTKPITDTTVPASPDAAKTALGTAIAGVNKASDPATITVTVTNVAQADATAEYPETTYTSTPETNPTSGEYKNVKITVGTGDGAITFKQDFHFAVSRT